MMSIVGGVEALLVLVSRPAYNRGISLPVQIFGILSVVVLSLGLFPQYWEIYVTKEVKGVSYTFLLIDMLGGILNILSLVFREEFDALAAASYTCIVVSNLFAIQTFNCSKLHETRVTSVVPNDLVTDLILLS